jgi:hypothetical protein
MCSLLMRLQRSTSLFNSSCFAAPWQHAEVNQKAQIAAATQNVKWKLRMKGLPMNRALLRTPSSSWLCKLRNVRRNSPRHSEKLVGHHCQWVAGSCF